MRRCRINLPNRCYHLISRVAHRAYFLDEGERTRLVDFVRRVAEFSGVKLLAYSVMSNHFHVFVYIGRPEPLSDAEIVRRISALYSDVRFVWQSGLTLLAPLRAELETLETASDVAFGDVLLERCSAMLSAELHRELKGRR